MIGACLVSLAAVHAGAEDLATRSHVRSESPVLRRLIADAMSGSPTFRVFVEEIDQSDVIVYVSVRVLSRRLDGRIGFVGARPGQRLLAIELAYDCPFDAQMPRLAHELQHALEIARAPWVVDAATLGEYYRRIGFQVSGDVGPAAYETADARAVSDRVRRELANSADSNR